MNYPGQAGSGQSGNGRPRRKPNFFLLLMLAVMAFFLYSQFQRPKTVQVPNNGTMPDITIPDISNDGQRTTGRRMNVNPHANPHSNSGGGSAKRNSDWSVDTDIPTKSVADDQTEVFVRPTNTGQEIVTRGDWELEQGASTPTNNRTNVLTPAAPKKTRDGDWGLEELPTNKK